MSGAIDEKGRAALVYWGKGPDYATSTLGCTLLDTRTGESRNVIADSPGAPYCYNQVFYNQTGLHILGIRSEVSDLPIAGTTNHYTDLRYYYCPDPGAANARWRHVVIMHNEHACIQPLGNLVDPSGRIHLLYQYMLDNGHGGQTKYQLVYEPSRDPISAARQPAFVRHELPAPGDGRLFMTKGGSVHVLAYTQGTSIEHTQVLDPVVGIFTRWESIPAGITLNRIFPIDRRSGSTASDDLAAVFISATHVPEKNSLFYFNWRPGK